MTPNDLNGAATVSDEWIDAIYDAVPWKDLNVNDLAHASILRHRFARALFAAAGEQAGAATAEQADTLTRELLDTLQSMVKHFTQTPSTLADSQMRGKAHEVIAKAYAQIGYGTSTQVSAPEALPVKAESGISGVQQDTPADHSQCCDTPAFCSSVRRCTAKDGCTDAAAKPADATPTAYDADMVWPADDGESMFHSIDDLVDAKVNEAYPEKTEIEVELEVAKRLPDATVRIFNITENGYEWEIVAASQPANGGDRG